MKTITSRTNSLVKHLALLQQKKYRAQYGQFCAEGERACTTLIKSGLKLLCIVVTEAMVARIPVGIPDELIIVVPEHVMEKISASESPSGLLAQFTIPPTPNPDRLSAGLVLARIADPGNMGTLIRTAAALNVSSIVVIESADPWSPKVVQASAGTIGMLSLFSWSWNDLIHYKKNYSLCALVVRGGKHPSEISLANTLLVVGSEAEGIPASWVAQCDEQLTLPMPGSTESLNAAVAGSIALYLATQ